MRSDCHLEFEVQVMRARERTSGPAWACFHADFRRRWRGRSIARALALLLLIFGVQFAVSLWWAQGLPSGLWTTPRVTWLFWVFWVFWLLSTFGLSSPFALLAFAGGS